MSLKADALALSLGLSGSAIHINGPVAAVALLDEEALARLGEIIVGCCIGAAVYGPQKCTCWQPVLDVEQAEVVEGPMPQREKCCGDCAYRHGSPERDGGFVEEALLDLPGQPGRVFACHQGMRRVVAWRHPVGLELPAGTGDYRPPRDAAGRAYRADGSPADLCAGWAALRG